MSRISLVRIHSFVDSYYFISIEVSMTDVVKLIFAPWKGRTVIVTSGFGTESQKLTTEYKLSGTIYIERRYPINIRPSNFRFEVILQRACESWKHASTQTRMALLYSHPCYLYSCV